MTDRTEGRRGTMRRVRDTAFALCTAWLVVQNLVLFVALACVARGQGPLTAGAVGRLLLAAVAPLWAIPAGALVLWAMIALLARVDRREDWRMDHERAR